MPTALDALLHAQRDDLRASLQHLRSSFQRVEKLPRTLEDLSDLQLETWEAFVSRFARATDLFLAKYLRTFVLVGDPAFRGSLRDFVNQAEKLGLVDDAAEWMAVRELRNTIAYEYSAGGLAGLFDDCLRCTPLVLAVEDRLEP